MGPVDYATEAALYCAKHFKGRQKTLTFQRFSHASEAIRFAIEELPPQALDGCSLEVNEERFFGKEIRPLYESDDYPLPRRTKTSI